MSLFAETPAAGPGGGRSEPRRRWPSGVPEQGLLGGRRLRPVCARAERRLLGHLLVDVPGGHCDPQHGGQCGVVQHDAHLAGERQVSGRRARGRPTPSRTLASAGRRSAVTGNEAQERTGLFGRQTPRVTDVCSLQGMGAGGPGRGPRGAARVPERHTRRPARSPRAQGPAAGAARAWTPGAAGRTPRPHSQVPAERTAGAARRFLRCL